MKQPTTQQLVEKINKQIDLIGGDIIWTTEDGKAKYLTANALYNLLVELRVHLNDSPTIIEEQRCCICGKAESEHSVTANILHLFVPYTIKTTNDPAIESTYQDPPEHIHEPHEHCLSDSGQHEWTHNTKHGLSTCKHCPQYVIWHEAPPGPPVGVVNGSISNAV